MNQGVVFNQVSTPNPMKKKTMTVPASSAPWDTLLSRATGFGLGRNFKGDLFAAPMNSGPCETVNNLGGAPPEGKQTGLISGEKSGTCSVYVKSG